MVKALRFKVKPRKNPLILACADEMSAVLACFASSGDIRAVGECATASKALHVCMSKTPKKIVGPKSSINYLLTKVRK